jgi:hypothetical protein
VTGCGGRIYRTGGAQNGVGISDPAVDAPIAQIAKVPVTYARDALIEDLWRRLVGEIVYVPLYTQVAVWAMRDNLECPVDPAGSMTSATPDSLTRPSIGSEAWADFCAMRWDGAHRVMQRRGLGRRSQKAGYAACQGSWNRSALNVSQDCTSPDCSPSWNQCTRCSELPWVNASGTT